MNTTQNPKAETKTTATIGFAESFPTFNTLLEETGLMKAFFEARGGELRFVGGEDEEGEVVNVGDSTAVDEGYKAWERYAQGAEAFLHSHMLDDTAVIVDGTTGKNGSDLRLVLLQPNLPSVTVDEYDAAPYLAEMSE